MDARVDVPYLMSAYGEELTVENGEGGVEEPSPSRFQLRPCLLLRSDKIEDNKSASFVLLLVSVAAAASDVLDATATADDIMEKSRTKVRLLAHLSDDDGAS